MAKKWRIALVLLFIIVSGSAFPIYNFGKHYRMYKFSGNKFIFQEACFCDKKRK